MALVYLFIAARLEIGFARLWPTLIVAAAGTSSFYVLPFSLEGLPVSGRNGVRGRNVRGRNLP